MTIDKGIFIKNIYYMLAYAFQELRQNNYAHIAGEVFENAQDLFAEIIAHGVSYQLKQGLHKTYIEQNDVMSTLRGKLVLNETLKEYSAQRRKLACEFDELSVNNVLNQILKSVMLLLTKDGTVADQRKTRMRKLLLYFAEVDTIDLRQVKWNSLRFDRNTRTYQMLMYLCYFVCEDLLLSTDVGTVEMAMFADERMCRLYEKFILEYYRRHHPELNTSAKQIEWNIKKESSSTNVLPIMQSDIYLTDGDRTLIIDAKYYAQSMAYYYDKAKLYSQNLYQINNYVFNEDRGHTGKVNGMLLYAKTNEEVVPDGNITTNDGNVVWFRTLDLNTDFDLICEQLNLIVKDNLKID